MVKRQLISCLQQFFLEKINCIEKIPRQASFRTFWRIYLNKRTLIAVVYPHEKIAEIENYQRIQRILVQNGLKVAAIIDRPAENILLLEDLGKMQLSRLSPAEIVNHHGKEIARILWQLSTIRAELTSFKLDLDRMRFEMNFFLKHFVVNFPQPFKADLLQKELEELINKIECDVFFAHRDFHSKNIHLYANQLYLVDFQDALQAPRYYDLVSFLFDSYKNYGKNRDKLLTFYEEMSASRVKEEQLLLTALQRNIKALGTFGYQVFHNQNSQYRFFIPRTINYILQHLIYFSGQFPVLNAYFSRLSASINGKIRREGY